MKLTRKTIKSNPHPMKLKIQELDGWVEEAQEYVENLRAVDIQPEFILKHHKAFRNLIFGFMHGELVDKRGLEDLNDKIKELEKRNKQLEDRLSKLEGQS